MEPIPEYFLPPHMMWQIAIFVFAFGCCVGSYLNVVIYRLPLGMKTSEPRRSFCPKCKYQIPMWHNIPILSWIVLGGKCANCKASISPRYLLVEFLTGLLYLLAFFHLGWDWRLLAAFTFISLAVAGSYIDIDHQILPHEITWGGTAAGLVAALAIPHLIVTDTRWINLAHSAGGAALGYGLIWCIVQLGKLAFGKVKREYDEPAAWSIREEEGAEEPVFRVAEHKEGWADIFNRVTDRMLITAPVAKLDDREWKDVLLTISYNAVKITPQDGGAGETVALENIKSMSGTCMSVNQPREAMGMGDANWMACTGAFFGWKAVLFTIVAGSCIGAGISIMMILLRRREWAARIPFGPYLTTGALIWLFLGPEILHWYLNLSRGAMPEQL